MGVDPDLRSLAREQGGVFTHLQALQSGYPHDEVLRLVRAGTWRRIRYGVMAEKATHERAGPKQSTDQLILDMCAVLVRLSPRLRLEP